MRKIIQGFRYDTDKAEAVASEGLDENMAHTAWHETTLYRTTRGHWFLSGKGGRTSIWGQRVAHDQRAPWSREALPLRSHDKDSLGVGAGIRPFIVHEAREWLEWCHTAEAEAALERYFAPEDA